MLFVLELVIFLSVYRNLAAAEMDVTWGHDLNKNFEAYKEKALSQDKKCPLMEEVRQLAKDVRQRFVNSHFESKSIPEKPAFLICVSFSMPLSTLKALARQAKPYGGVLTLRGLVKGSFPETVKVLHALGEEIQIDPTVFDEFNITHVPLFILRQKETYDTLSGNVSVSYALKTFAQKGDLKELAQTLLQKGGKS